MILNGDLQTQTFEYNFATDPSAGAIGNINLGAHLPKHVWVYAFWAGAIIQPVGAGATISFGFITTAIAPPFAAPAAYLLPLAPAGFVVGIPVFGVNMLLVPQEINQNSDVTMSIGGAPLTAGRLKCVIMYSEFDI